MAFDVTLPQESLQRLLQAAGRAIAARPQQRVLLNVLLEAGEASLTATGYNLELGVRCSAIASVAGTGAVAVPHRLLASLAAALPVGSSVTLRAGTGEESLQVEAGEGRYSVQLADDPDEYPQLPAPGDYELFSVPFGVLKKALTAVAYAASIEVGKPQLNGVHFAAGTGELSLTATDGHRAAFYSLPEAIEAGAKWSAIVPTVAVKELQRMGLADDDLVIVNEGKGVALFDGGDMSIVTNLVAGDYPPMRSVVPKTGKHRLTADRQGLVEAIERAKVIADQEGGVVRIAYDDGTGEVSIKAENITGAAADSVTAQSGSKGPAIALSMHSKYLLDALGHLSGKTAVIQANSPVAPLVFMSEGNTLEVSMVMPMGPKPTAAA